MSVEGKSREPPGWNQQSGKGVEHVGKSGEDSDSDNEPELLQFKVLLLGDGAVGKTSVAMRFTEDYFSMTYKQTIGVDFFMKRLVLPGDVHVALQIWDIGGQSIGSKMVSNYIYGAQAVIYLYDITNYQSFQNLESWHRLVNKTFGKEKPPYSALIGNKSKVVAGREWGLAKGRVRAKNTFAGPVCILVRRGGRVSDPVAVLPLLVCVRGGAPPPADLSHIRAVRMDRHTAFSDENEMFSYLMSAKTGDQVNAALYRIAADLAGVVLTRPEIEVASKPVRAEIVAHDRNDEAVPDAIPNIKPKCIVQ